MKKTILTLILGIFLISLAGAQVFVFEQNVESNITITCLNNGYCSNTSNCNINVYSPTGDLVIENQNMTMADSFFYIPYTATVLGTYVVTGFCTDDNLYGDADYTIIVTPDGNLVNTGESMMYIWILIILGVLITLGIYASYKIPYQNIMDNNSIEKIVIKITKTKYVKLLTIWLTSGIILMFVTILTGMINNYVQFIEMKGMFTAIYTFLYVIGYGMSTFIIILLFINFWKDILLNKQIVKHGKAFIEENARRS